VERNGGLNEFLLREEWLGNRPEDDKLVAAAAWTGNSKWIDETVEKWRFRCEVVREGRGKDYGEGR